MKTCPYRHLLGVEGKGVHAYRLGGVAIVDVLFTFLASWLLYWYTKWPFLWVLLGLFLLGIVLHRLFCVRTTIDKFLFG